MGIDLHTLRLTGGRAAAEWAMEQENWAIIGTKQDFNQDIHKLTGALRKLGRAVHMVCLQSTRLENIDLNAHETIEDIDSQVDVIILLGDLDHWDLVSRISQRMQWYGDIKIIWSQSEMNDERWVSEMYDYGIAVVDNCPIETIMGFQP